MRTVANRTEQEGKKMIEQLLKKKEVMAAANLGPAKLRELVKAGKFPRPIPFGYRTKLWVGREVYGWINQQTGEIK